MPLNNFGFVCAVNSSALYRSAQPGQEGFNTALGLGVRTIIKLNEGPEGPFYLMRIQEIPMRSWFFDVPLVKSGACAISESLKIGSVLVHCTHGRDRTGLLIAAYRLMYCGFSLKQANAERALYGVVGLDAILDFDMDGMLAEIASPRG